MTPVPNLLILTPQFKGLEKPPQNSPFGEPILQRKPLTIDPAWPALDGEAFVRAEQILALLQRRLIQPLSSGGPRSEPTLTQYHVLSFLATRGNATVSELTHVLGFAQSTTSALVDRLAKMGWVEKRRDSHDQRITRVLPLPKGLRVVQRYRKNAERSLIQLMEMAGPTAVRDLFDALSNASLACSILDKEE